MSESERKNTTFFPKFVSRPGSLFLLLFDFLTCVQVSSCSRSKGRGQVRLIRSSSIITCADFIYCRAGPDEYSGLMNAVKRHVDSSVQKLETKSSENHAALKTEFDSLKKQNAQLVKQNA